MRLIIIWLALVCPASAAWADDVVTVHTRDGSVYRGELVEQVTGDHVTVKVASGPIRRIAWRDVEAQPVAPPDEVPPIETVYAVDGSVYHGEIVEKVHGDHITLRVPPGNLRRIDWDDITRPEPPAVCSNETVRAPRRPRDVLIFEADHSEATLQRVLPTSYEDVCTVPCDERSVLQSGQYRVAGEGLVPTKPFMLQRGERQHVFALMKPAEHRVAGGVLVGTSVPFMAVGASLFIVAAGVGTNAGGDGSLWAGAASVVSLVGLALFVPGMLMLALAPSSSVAVNGLRF